MAEVRFTGVVSVPREEVFDSFADSRNWVHFSPGVEAVDDVEDWGRPGGRCRLTLRLLRRRRFIDCEMTEIQRPLLFRYLAPSRSCWNSAVAAAEIRTARRSAAGDGQRL